MHDKLFEAALGIARLWFVAGVRFDEAAKVLTVRIDFAPGSRFGVEGAVGQHPVHDSMTKRYRHLNSFQHECVLEVRTPRVKAARRLSAVSQAGVCRQALGPHAAVRGADPHAGAADALCRGGAHGCGPEVRVIVDTTAQEMAIAYPTDSRSLEVVREKIARPAKRVGIQLKFMHKREGEPLRRRAAGYLHAKQFKRLKKVLQRQRSIPGRVPREVRCKMSALSRDIEAHGDSEIAVIPEGQYVIPFARAPKDTARTGGTA